MITTILRTNYQDLKNECNPLSNIQSTAFWVKAREVVVAAGALQYTALHYALLHYTTIILGAFFVYNFQKSTFQIPKCLHRCRIDCVLGHGDVKMYSQYLAVRTQYLVFWQWNAGETSAQDKIQSRSQCTNMHCTAFYCSALNCSAQHCILLHRPPLVQPPSLAPWRLVTCGFAWPGLSWAITSHCCLNITKNFVCTVNFGIV